MLKRWIFYIAAVLSCLIFWAAHQSWIAWSLLSAVLWLPGFSLALSLIPMLSTKTHFSCPAAIDAGTKVSAVLHVQNRFPQPPFRCKLRLTHTFTGTDQKMKIGEALPTAHCGALLLDQDRVWVSDYLGLFSIPLTRSQIHKILIHPTPVPMDAPQDLQRLLARSWQPKPGGGFAENHEMRLYRPGDSLNQIHWKLTAKTGKLMVREAMIPRCGRILLTTDLCGTAEELDRKLGRLLWLSNYLLEQPLSFEIRIFCGNGLLTFPVSNQKELLQAMDEILCCSPASAGTSRNPETAASWHFHIGGEPDEA